MANKASGRSAHLKAVPNTDTDFKLQSTALHIWDEKYRLKAKDGTAVDETIDDTYKRIAHALSETETTVSKREKWAEKLLWALPKGVIQAGRISSWTATPLKKVLTANNMLTIVCGNIPAKPRLAPVSTLKSRGFFYAWRKQV